MYQPYPSGGQMPTPPARPTPPGSVRTAVRLMYAGAALSAISLVVTALSLHSIETVLHHASPSLSTSQVHGLAIAAVAIGVVESLIGIGLWLFMAWANNQGKNWARITASVLFGIDSVLVLFSLTRASASLGLVFTIVVWLVGLGVVVMLWRKDATEFFRAAGGHP